MELRRDAPDMLVDRIGLHFQPIVCLSLGLTHGAHAVPVARHANVAAACASSLASTDGSLASTVLDLAAAAVAAAGPAANVAVELPAPAWNDALLGLTEWTVAKHGIATNAISFMISADEASHDATTAAAIVDGLHVLGCKVGIDGVGTSFGSVRLLHVLPVDFARIHPLLVADMLAHPAALAEATGVLRLAAEAGVPTMAPGVDSPEQTEWLRDLGCGFATGPFFGQWSDQPVLPTPHRCDTR